MPAVAAASDSQTKAIAEARLRNPNRLSRTRTGHLPRSTPMVRPALTRMNFPRRMDGLRFWMVVGRIVPQARQPYDLWEQIKFLDGSRVGSDATRSVEARRATIGSYHDVKEQKP